MLETVAGRGLSPSLILVYVRGLPDTSLTHALMRGGREYHGWGMDRYLAASTHDLLTFDIKSTNNWGKTPPDLPYWHRPGMHAEEAKPKVTVASLWGQFKNRR